MSADVTQPDGLPFEPTPSIEDTHIGRVYADALLNAAVKQDAVEEVLSQLDELVGETFRRQPQVEEFLRSGIISEEHKDRVLKNVFQERASPLFYNFLMVLSRHERLGLLRAVRLEFRRLNNQRQGRIPVRVQAAVPLTDDQLNRLRQDLHASFGLEPILDVQVDPALLGGLVVRVGDWLFDRSVRSELRSLQKQIMSKGSSAIQSRGERFGTIGE